MSLIERIDALLDERKISRRQLAIMANIPPSSLQSAMSRGKNMTVEMLQAIAEALDVPVSYFQNESNCIDVNLQRRVLAKIQERIDSELSGVDKADLSEVLGATSHDGYFNDVYEGTSPLTEDRLLEIADELGRDIDYLLGFVEDETPEQTVCGYTGLNEGAVQYIRTLYKLRYVPPGNRTLDMLNQMMPNHHFDSFLGYCAQYVRNIQVTPEPQYAGSPDFLYHRDELAKHGHSISTPAREARLLFQDRVVTALKDLLDSVAMQLNSSDQNDAEQKNATPEGGNDDSV